MACLTQFVPATLGQISGLGYHSSSLFEQKHGHSMAKLLKDFRIGGVSFLDIKEVKKEKKEKKDGDKKTLA